MSAEPAPVQTFPVHIIHFLRDVYKDATLFEQCWHKRLLQRSDKWRGRLYAIGEVINSAIDTSTGKARGRSRQFLSLTLAGAVCCLDNCQMGGCRVQLLVSDLRSPDLTRHKTNTYAKGVMQITAETFRKCANELPESVTNRKRLSIK